MGWKEIKKQKQKNHGAKAWFRQNRIVVIIGSILGIVLILGWVVYGVVSGDFQYQEAYNKCGKKPIVGYMAIGGGGRKDYITLTVPIISMAMA